MRSDLSPLEVASGLILGEVDDVEPLPTPEPGKSAREALEDVVLAGLLRPPCVVSFSGGRDSSAVLAVAMHVARRHGTEEPIPVSLRFPEVKSTDESEWQEKVVRHLGVAHWERILLTDEADSLGPYAVGVLRRHGLLWPHNTHFHVPVCEHARGGSVLTGVGGDELLLPSAWVRLNHVLVRSARPEPRDLARLVLAYGPRLGRRMRFRRQAGGLDMPWLRPEASEALRRCWTEASADEAVAWDDWVRRSWWHYRSRVVGRASLARVTGDVGAVAIHPLQDGRFLATIAAERGRAGFRNRTTAMRELFGDVLPPEALSRWSKAFFDDVFWGPYSREFARHWDGRGLDEDVVDVEALRRMWTGDAEVDGRSLLLLQAAWLAGDTTVDPAPARPAPQATPADFGARSRRAVAGRPNFLLVGAAKSGTSAFYLALKDHPDVYMSPVKEPHYFAYLADRELVGDVYDDVETAHRKYGELFRDIAGEAAIGEGSTSNLCVPGTAEAIEHTIPDARIVAILRNPVDRAYSHFRHFVDAGAETTTDFGEAVREEEERLRGGLPFTYGYKRWGRYHRQLEPFVERFGRERVQVHLYEDYQQDAQAVLRATCGFLGVDSGPAVPVVGRHNVGGAPRGPRSGRVARRLRRPAGTATPAPMGPQVRAELIEEFRPEIVLLQDLIGRDLSAWLR